ncbi:MAG: VIT domain-containing protein [Myxococcota bacterium]
MGSSRFWAVFLLVAACGGEDGELTSAGTVATLTPVRGSGVFDRIAVEESISVESLSRLHLDTGPRLLLESATVKLDPEGVVVVSGDAPRAFVQVLPGDTIVLQRGEDRFTAQDASFSLEGDAVYVVSGEVAVSRGEEDRIIVAGDQLVAGAVSSAQLWEDWTGGLARSGPGLQGDVAIGALTGRVPNAIGRARWPLVIQRLNVSVRVVNNLAITEVEQVFFNPASEVVEGLYQIAVPDGAVLQRFSVDRNGRLVDGYVREKRQAQAAYEAQVYQGSTLDPALLEWVSPGNYQARIYPIPPGATRRIVVRYGEWLQHPRVYRFPMASEGGPRIQELSFEADLSESGATGVVAGFDAEVDGLEVRARRSDFQPRADLYLELVDAEDAPVVAWRAAHQTPERDPRAGAVPDEDEVDYLYIPLVLPDDVFEGDVAESTHTTDVVIVADVSAGTDASHLELGRSVVESLTAHLGLSDRVAIVASDVGLRPLGEAEATLGPADPARVESLLNALAREPAGGASDLGSALAEAASLLDPTRHGIVIYVGDGAPTVGELQADALLERVQRLPHPLRAYAVGVGAQSNLELLAALTRGSGRALRVETRSAAADAALEILAHARHPSAHRVTVSIDGAEQVFPRSAADVVQGAPLAVVGRIEGSTPATITVRGEVGGTEFEREISIQEQRIEDDGDLRLRWAAERLHQLLLGGAQREEIADLGVRYGIITPFTSFYVPSAAEMASLGERGRHLLRHADGFTERPRYALLPSLVALSMPGCRDAEPAVGSQPELQIPHSTSRAEPSDSPVPVEVATEEEAPPAEPEPTAEPSVARPGSQNELGGFDNRATSMRSGNRYAITGAEDSNAVPEEPAADVPETATARPIQANPYGGTARETARNSGVVAALREQQGQQTPARTRRRGELADLLAADDDTEEERNLEGAGRGGGGSGAGTLGLGALGEDLDLDLNIRTGNRQVHVRVRERARAHRVRRCSDAADLLLDGRREIWRERLGAANGVNGWLEVLRNAERACEIRTWRDRRAMLDLILQKAGSIATMIRVHRFLTSGGARRYVRRAILRRVRTPDDLRLARNAFGSQRNAELIAQVLERAGDAAARIRALTALRRQFPRDLDLALQLLEELERQEKLDRARRLARALRADPLSDAGIRTAIGEMHLRLGDETRARRVFSEIVEFAPQDALARRRLGDLYRAHGWFEDAYRQYQTLQTITPDDPTVALLLAQAAAGAGRVDEALRLEQGLAESTGGEAGLGRVALLWSSVRFAELRKRARDEGDSEQLAALAARMRRSGVLRQAGDFRATLVWAHPDAKIALWASHPRLNLSRPRDLAPEFGLEAFDVEDQEEGTYRLQVRRPEGRHLARVSAKLVVVWNEGQDDETIVVQPITLEGSELRTTFEVTGRDLREVAQ